MRDSKLFQVTVADDLRSSFLILILRSNSSLGGQLRTRRNEERAFTPPLRTQ